MRAWAAALIVGLSALAACSPPKAKSVVPAVCIAQSQARAVLEGSVARCSALIATAKGDQLTAALVARSELYRLAKNDPAALRDAQQVLSLDPANSTALDQRGLVLSDQGDLAGALSSFSAAIRAVPSEPTGYNNRGVIEWRQGNLAAAMRDENRAIELDPASANAWSNRGLVFVAQHRWELALADFADALRLDPQHAYAMDGVGQADLGKGDVPHAVISFNQSADAYFDSADYAAALTEADKALTAKPDDPESLNNRCWTRAVANIELDKAQADCARSLQLRPDDAATLDSRAMVSFRRGDFAAAIEGYDAALAKNPQLAQSMFMRGVAKLRAGDRAGGQADIQAAERMDANVADQFAGYGLAP